MIVTKEDLIAFIKDNLEIRTEPMYPYTEGNDTKVSLFIKGEKHPFDSDIIYIPEDL